MTAVLIAPDKFKGSLTAAEVAEVLSRGLTRAGIETIALPLADGGDGSVAAALAAGFGSHRTVVRGATGNEHTVSIAVSGATAVVEIANICGLSTLPGGRLSPLTASSYGLGQGLRRAMELGVRRVVLGLGGSASSDAGVGMLAALGYRFLDRDGRDVAPVAANLQSIHTVDGSGVVPGLSGIELVVASDVTNPLVGPDGAARVYGPQKGADATDIRVLENGYDALIRALVNSGTRDAHALAHMAGSGSAGGAGFAAALLGARLVSGANFFLDLLDFEKHCAGADLVITGEGCLDSQTLSGKLPSIVAQRSGDRPVIAVVGANRIDARRAPFAKVFAASEYSSIDTAGDPVATNAALLRISQDIAGIIAAQQAERSSAH
ncbi:glycerate kinase [Mycolicibacterium bacteremicum]|uniref:glycerate kinase n=1 Tax=Mycolicibacterium bacteremicum TaxID=564198 RepID=UPI0026F0D0E4|nr:glycerate kinase [Mycolicibacterium bacteremicum]